MADSSNTRTSSESHSTSVPAPTLELKPLKNVMPIVPAQQVDSSCPPSGETTPVLPASPDGTHIPDNDESGVENITQVFFSGYFSQQNKILPLSSIEINRLCFVVLC